MSCDNKENTVPNQSRSLFSNPVICAKMFNSNHFYEQNQNVKSDHHIKFHSKKFDKMGISLDHPQQTTMAQQIQNISKPAVIQKEGSIFDSYKKQICQKHLKPLSNLFCNNCLSYNICRTCISDIHSQHQVMQFTSQKQLINETKSILIQNLDQTLKQLKSKQNQVKNRVHEVNLVKNSLRSLEEDIISIISGFFRDIEGKLLTSIQKNQDDFDQEVEQFFQGFNKTNDDLRQNLMKIFDGQINIKQFDKKMIIKDAPPIPNFSNYKTTLQKYKKVFKDIKTELSKIKITIDEGIKSTQVPQNQHFKNVTNATLLKFDKYIDNNHKTDKVNQHFLKTLRLLDMPTSRENISNYNAVRGQAKSITRKIF